GCETARWPGCGPFCAASLTCSEVLVSSPRARTAFITLLLCLHFGANGLAQDAAQPARSGQEVYETICIACHGPDGRGGTEMAKTIPLPDFTDCSFASREPDDDWLAVAHYGGPARGFSPLMPPW